MARIISLAKHFTSDELKTCYQSSTDPHDAKLSEPQHILPFLPNEPQFKGITFSNTKVR